jgi:hypothetical protein
MIRFALVSGFLCVNLIAVSCKQRNYNSESKSDTNDDKRVIQIDAAAINAYMVWKEGEAPVAEFKYDINDPANGDPDGTFYVAREEYWEYKGSQVDDISARFKREFTPGIRKDKSAGVLTYPKNKDGKELNVEFTDPSQEALTQKEAIEYCEKENKRLPTVRELYDYCGDKMEPITCDRELLWSLSVRAAKDDKYGSKYSAYAWAFDGDSNYVTLDPRVVKGVYRARCVGPVSK